MPWGYVLDLCYVCDAVCVQLCYHSAAGCPRVRVYATPGLGAGPEPGLLIFDGEMLKYLRVKQQESGLATGSK